MSKPVARVWFKPQGPNKWHFHGLWENHRIELDWQKNITGKKKGWSPRSHCLIGLAFTWAHHILCNYLRFKDNLPGSSSNPDGRLKSGAVPSLSKSWKKVLADCSFIFDLAGWKAIGPRPQRGLHMRAGFRNMRRSSHNDYRRKALMTPSANGAIF